MAAEVAVFLQPRVAVAGEHLAVGVDVDPLALGLLEQLLQVLEVVAGNQDGLALLRAEGNGRGDGVAVGARVGRIEKLHRPQVDLAALEHERQGRLETDFFIGQGGQRLVDEGVHGRVFLAQDLGVIGVGRHALDPEEQGVLEGKDVGVGRRVGHQPHLFPLGHEPFQGAAHGLKVRASMERSRLPPEALTFPMSPSRY